MISCGRVFAFNPGLQTLEILGFHFHFAQKWDEWEVYYERRFQDNLSQKEIQTILTYQLQSAVRYRVNLDEPKTFNEKLQWLKMYYHNPLITQCADKVASREYVRRTVGEQCGMPEIIAVYKRPEEINFNALPEQFVLKVNWGSGQNIICKDKSRLDIEETSEKLRYWLRPEGNHYYAFFEWGYKLIPPAIVCEKYLQGLESSQKVYKIMCFNGQPRIIQLVLDDKLPGETINYYDTDWNWLPFRQNFPNHRNPQEKPERLEQMLEIAKELSAPFPFVRVDLFHIEGEIFFSEMTFYSDAGHAAFHPQLWDFRLGEWITLPSKPKTELVLK